MKKSKKNVVGPAAFWMLLSGENNQENKDLSVKIAVFYLPEMLRKRSVKIALSGLRNGF